MSSSAGSSSSGGVSSFDPFDKEAFLAAAQAFLEPENGWSAWKEKKGLVLQRKPVPGNPLKAMRGNLRIKCDPERFLAAFSDHDVRKKWDKRFLSGEVIEDLGDGSVIGVDKIKAPAIISNREVVFVRHLIRQENGAIWQLSRSVNREDVPVSKGYVRGDLQMQAFHIQPTEDGGTDLTFGALMDPMGKIPKWVVNKASGQQVNITLKMRDLFESMAS